MNYKHIEVVKFSDNGFWNRLTIDRLFNRKKATFLGPSVTL